MDNLKKIFSILQYIVINNAWYKVPYVLFFALSHQLCKRLFGIIYSRRLFNGKKIFIFPYSPISSAFIYSPFPDRNEILALRAMATQNTVFLDVGANIGAYSVLLMDKVRSVYAFEAHPYTAQLCKMNFLLNGSNESYVIEGAVGKDKNSQYFSNLPKGSPVNAKTDDKNSIKVSGITLDSFFLQNNFSKEIEFIIKIDVEGFEYDVLYGAQELIKKQVVKGILLESFSNVLPLVREMLENGGFQLQTIGMHNLLAIRTVK